MFGAGGAGTGCWTGMWVGKGTTGLFFFLFVRRGWGGQATVWG